MSNYKDITMREKLVQIKRVTKVTKGGKNLGFTAFVIVSDNIGSVGLATAKSKEVPLAIKRSIERAKKHIYKINILEDTIPYQVVGKYKSSTVVIRPAPEGTGVIAGGSIRILLESLGLQNVVAKSIGSNNPLNMAKAALNGLLKLKSREQIEELRGVKISIKNKTATHEITSQNQNDENDANNEIPNKNVKSKNNHNKEDKKKNLKKDKLHDKKEN